MMKKVIKIVKINTILTNIVVNFIKKKNLSLYLKLLTVNEVVINNLLN